MKRIAVLGSTGSIGTQGLDIIRHSNGEFSAVALCADRNAALLAKQANEFHPEIIGIVHSEKEAELSALLNYKPQVVSGADAAAICAAYTNADIVLNSVSGISGFQPLIAAINSGKTVAAANKESIICAHSLLEKSFDNSLVMPRTNGSRIIPVDSEQSAIFQCLEHKTNIKSLVLTASGGAFRDLPISELRYVTARDALRHPTWSMGAKITIDSASMVNKGLEIMEAAFLFGFDASSVEVLIHKQSIVHSLVKFRDGSLKAQLSAPDMRIAIQYAFTYPDRVPCPAPDVDLTAQELTFSRIDEKKYPAVPLAYEALRDGKALPVAYCSASEVAADAFINGRCSFTDIAKIMEYAMKKTDTGVHYGSVSDIMETDKDARAYALEFLSIK